MNLLFFIFIIAGTVYIALSEIKLLGSLNVTKCENPSIEDGSEYNDFEQSCNINYAELCKDYCGCCKIIELVLIIKDGCQHNSTFLLEFLHCIGNEIGDAKPGPLIELANSIRAIIACVTPLEKTSNAIPQFNCNAFDNILQIPINNIKIPINNNQVLQHVLNDMACIRLFHEAVENIQCLLKD